jgi:RNA polymerase sigma factor (sigma-70 family)
MMTESQTLLAEYVRTGSELAFRELVTRYLGLVYSAALRLVGGDAHLTEDVSQIVFLHLARKAHRLPREVMLGGWLHRDTCHVARTLMRSERRRQKRERQAMEMNLMEDHSASNLAALAPVLDEAIEELRAEDRMGILLRFFEQRDFRSVGEALGSNEEAARKRVARAVEKLHELLKGRGVSLSVAALGTVLTTEVMTAAPVGLAASIAGTALAGAATSTGLSVAMIKMAALTKLQAGLLGAVILVGTVTAIVVQQQARGALRGLDESLQQQAAELARQQSENARLAGLVQADESRANSLADLLSLRSEIESLRAQTNRLVKDLEENRRSRIAAGPQVNASQSLLREREDDQRQALAKMNFTRQWLLAILTFANEHDDQFPNNVEEARQYLEKEAAAKTNLTIEQFELLYRGSRTGLAAETVVLREKQAHQSYDGKWARCYGFADGHSEIPLSRNANFEAWEKRHIIPRPPNR